VTPAVTAAAAPTAALAFASGRQPRTRDTMEWCWRMEFVMVQGMASPDGLARVFAMPSVFKEITMCPRGL
jgi:hypothetical protein